MQLIQKIIRGAIIGVANIIPGVSGGTMMVSMGIYDTIIHCITHLFRQFKKSVTTLLPYAIGMLLGIFALASLLKYLFAHYALPTNTAFIGLILGGIFPLLRKIDRKKLGPAAILVFILFFALIIVMALAGDTQNPETLPVTLGNVVMMLITGAIAAATMIIPGVSGSMVLMLMGYYTPVLNAVNTLKDAALGLRFGELLAPVGILLPFGIGVLLGIFGVAKLIEYLLSRFPTITYCGVLGLVVASPVAILLRTDMAGVTGVTIGISLLTFALGFAVSALLARGEGKDTPPPAGEEARQQNAA